MAETETLQMSGDEAELFREIDAILDSVDPKVGFGEYVIDPGMFGYISLGRRRHVGDQH